MNNDNLNFDNVGKTKPTQSTSFQIAKMAMWLGIGLAVLWAGYTGVKKFSPELLSKTESVAVQTPIQVPATATPVVTPTAQVDTIVKPTTSVASIPNGTGVKICRGPDTGAFIQVFQDLNAVDPTLNLNGIKTTGAVENMELLLNGTCDFALVDPDDRARRLNMDPVTAQAAKKARTVIALYDGEVNMIGVDSNLQKYSQFTDSTRFGVSGGAVATFQTIQDLTGMKFSNITTYATTDQQKTALKNGEIDVIIANGAYEQPWIKSISIPGAHMIQFDRFAAVSNVMFTGPKGGYFGKRTPKYASLGNTAVEVLSTRTVIATTDEAQKNPENQLKAQAIFSAIKKHIYTLQGNENGKFHDSWKRIATMNDPGGMPWAKIENK